MLELLDYRRRVCEMYQRVREQGTERACAQFRSERDLLYRTHSQSVLDDAQKAAFQGLRYYPYNPAYRVVGEVDTQVEPITYDFDLGADGITKVRLFAQVSFELPTGTGTLGLFWIEGYGGGVFLPFRDATGGKTTYGGGRYLYDTIKCADLGSGLDTLMLDFNYAYNPSCYYNPMWVCPLAPPSNRLAIPVEAGERLMEGSPHTDA